MTDGPPRDYGLLVPPGWYRVPLDDQLPLRIKQIAESRTGGLPPQERESARTLITRLMSEETSRARSLGGLDLFIHLDPIKRTVVPASCLVTHVAIDARATGELVAAFRETDPDLTVESLTVVEIAGEAAVRRQSRRSFAAELVGTDREGQEAPARVLDVAVPIPRSRGMLMFSFATPEGPLADPMTALFDAMVGNLRWVG